MSEHAPIVSLNSPIIRKAAKRARLSVSEFVELCTLSMIRLIEADPDLFSGPGKTPSERLEHLRIITEFCEKLGKLPPDEQEEIRAMIPGIEPTNKEQ